ncbi:kinetochore protein Mis18 [Schizosaccharomyces octosporus yFS286]|uniref:Kinetochore protein Mis18 n=1 Tax=Schizosaccharomyces octosporus (strain yFS286) TaxID=483514 RepID=S9PV77_SCHOY|nr:kinetochore protein Mis18 [Schizosaccharomyces octosporus yFS286]EPX71892.1 kinetochore protein Mis18 [Schizosaccharomyces octosporus yFS286]
MSEGEANAVESADNDFESPPTVFQCKNCLQIVGDSNAWVISHREMGSFTLSDLAENTFDIEELLRTSDDGLCVYSLIKCTKCNTSIGCVFRSTPRYLDDIRDMYTLTMDKISAYEIGAKTVNPEGLTRYQVDLEIKEDILKLKSFCLSLYEKCQSHSESIESVLNTISRLPSELKEDRILSPKQTKKGIKRTRK